MLVVHSNAFSLASPLSLPLCPFLSLCFSLSLSLCVSDTCCISDFSLAVTGDSCIETELKTRPHADPRYMAPEFLADPSAQNNMESLKKGDMYSYGLVLWEIARRCTVLGECSIHCRLSVHIVMTVYLHYFNIHMLLRGGS